MPLPPALNLKQTRVENSIHLMKRLIFIVAACSVALPLFGQEKSPQLKDQKDKVSLHPIRLRRSWRHLKKIWNKNNRQRRRRTPQKVRSFSRKTKRKKA